MPKCKAACHAARQARGGLGLALRPRLPIARCEARLLPKQLTAVRGGFELAPLGPALTSLERKAAYTTRLAELGAA